MAFVAAMLIVWVPITRKVQSPLIESGYVNSLHSQVVTFHESDHCVWVIIMSVSCTFIKSLRYRLWNLMQN